MGKSLRIMVWVLFVLIVYISANLYVSYRTIYLGRLVKLFTQHRHTSSRLHRSSFKVDNDNQTSSISQESLAMEIQKMAESKYLGFFEDEWPQSEVSFEDSNLTHISHGHSKYDYHVTTTSMGYKTNTESNSTRMKNKKEKGLRKPDCYNLVSPNDAIYQEEVALVKKWKKTIKPSGGADWNILKLIQNCSSVHGYLRRFYHMSDFKEKYSVAYTILLDRSLEQTFRFLQNIYTPNSIYCLHINLKAGKNYVRVIKSLAECVDNIVLPDERFRLGIQTIYKIHAQMACFRRLLSSSVRWSFLINLPGSAFPLRNQSMVESYLKTRDHSNEISSRIPTSSRFFKRTRFEHVFQEVDGMNIYMRTKKRKPPPPGQIALFRGDEYFIATRHFCIFVTESNIASDFLDWAYDTKNPEEFYWASLHRYPGAPGGVTFRDEDESYSISPLGSENEDVADIPESDLLLTLWKSDGRHKCNGDYRGNLCVYGAGDLRWIIGQDKLFASSFDFKVDRYSVECLMMHLRRPLVEDHSVDIRSDLPVIL